MIIEPLTEKTWGRDCDFDEPKNKERNGETGNILNE